MALLTGALALIGALAPLGSDLIEGFEQNGGGPGAPSVSATQDTRVQVTGPTVSQSVSLGGPPDGNVIAVPVSLIPGMVDVPGIGADARVTPALLDGSVTPALFDTVFESGATQTPWILIAVVGLGAFLLAKFSS